jgi:hypothetical protein
LHAATSEDGVAWVQGKRKIKRAGGYADNTEPWGKGKDQEWGVVGKETQQRAKKNQRTKRKRRHHIGTQSHRSRLQRGNPTASRTKRQRTDESDESPAIEAASSFC